MFLNMQFAFISSECPHEGLMAQLVRLQKLDVDIVWCEAHLSFDIAFMIVTLGVTLSWWCK